MTILLSIIQGGIAGLLCAATVILLMHLFERKDGELSPYATRSAFLAVWMVTGLLYLAVTHRWVGAW